MATINKIAGMFDPISTELSVDMWEGFNLKKEVKDIILARLSKILPYSLDVFSSITLIGSMLGYQYNDGSDIDIGIQLKPEHDELFLSIKEICKATNGWNLPGTKHPINFFPSVSARLFRLENLTAGYDLLNDVWIKLPSKPTYSEQHQYDMSMPYLNLRKNELKRQLNQLVKNPNKEQEAVEVAKEFARLDMDRKRSYDYPGIKGGTRSINNAAFKYSLKSLDEPVIEALYHILKSKGLTFYE